VEVALLDLLGELEIGQRVVLVRLAQDPRQLGRRQPVARIAGDGLANAGERRPGDVLGQQLAAKRRPH
jgi:hypothetical protein